LEFHEVFPQHVTFFYRNALCLLAVFFDLLGHIGDPPHQPLNLSQHLPANFLNFKPALYGVMEGTKLDLFCRVVCEPRAVQIDLQVFAQAVEPLSVERLAPRSLYFSDDLSSTICW